MYHKKHMDIDRIVVVHQLSYNSAIIDELLEDKSLIVITTRSTKELIEMLDLVLPDIILILLDIEIKKIIELEVFSYLKNHPKYHKIPCCFIETLGNNREYLYCSKQTNLLAAYPISNDGKSLVTSTVKKILAS